METVAWLLLIGLALWCWQASLRSRELATRVCRQACRSHEVQFLDGTVCSAGLRLRRLDNGGFGLVRIYQFSFSYDGTDRHQGTLTLVANNVETLYFAPPNESKWSA